MPCPCNRKRVEAQLQDLTEKSEKKKAEVKGFWNMVENVYIHSMCNNSFLYIYFKQIMQLQSQFQDLRAK
jgi:hypothetical protein